MKIKNTLIGLLLNISAVLTVQAQPRVAVSRISYTKTIPKSTLTIYNGVNYHYANGIYYRRYNAGYTVVRPPIGIHVNVLPIGFTSLTLGGNLYYYSNDVYYIQLEPNIYKVVEKPAVTIVCEQNFEFIPQLPDSAELITINDKKYYRVNDSYYEKITSENGDVIYKKAGKKTK
ncbi:DUF6515 family protein [Flavobacterium bizetiae]|uniref:DUF6515 family protein n=1 Tax=Flavobacterium bizetiae TaxID=2704140 RepID=UPI003756613E